MGAVVAGSAPSAGASESGEAGEADEPERSSAIPGREPDDSRRRFILAAVIGSLVAAVPFLWVLWALWGSPTAFRLADYQTNFYDLQTRAMFHGHLRLTDGSIGIEAFLHDGHQYTYFGLFPSLLRVPIMAVTRSLDGQLTAPSILLAWMLTGLFVPLLFWRLRILIRGTVVLGRAESTSWGVLIAAIMAGSTFMVLAATPYVFAEDLAWSVCLTVGSLFALLGVLERPSWPRVLLSGVLVLAANLDRLTTGWACVIAAVLIATWFGIGRGGADSRKWCVPMVAVGLVPLAAGCAVNYAKFGIFFGVPVTDQLYTHVNAYRRRFLAANHNSEVGTAFALSDFLAYFRPDGLRLTSYFPFITLPAKPAPALLGVLFDKRYRTASVPSSMPLLFLLSCWGLVTAFRPKPVGRVALTRFLLLAAGAGGAALLLWGYIAPRYLADFMPLLILASGIASVDIWRRLAARSATARIGVGTVIIGLALFSIAANIGMAITPNEEWHAPQLLNYVRVQNALGSITGQPLARRVVRGGDLPLWAPADQLFIVGNCNGLYISNGEDYASVPAQQYQRATWMAVQRGHYFQHVFELTVSSPRGDATESLPLLQAGHQTVTVTAGAGSRPGAVALTFGLGEAGNVSYGNSYPVRAGTTQQVVVVTDTAKHLAQVTVDGKVRLSKVLTNGEPIGGTTGSGHSGGSPPALSARDITMTTPLPSLCFNLLRGSGPKP